LQSTFKARKRYCNSKFIEYILRLLWFFSAKGAWYTSEVQLLYQGGKQKKRKEKIEEKEPQESTKLINGVIPSSTNEYIKCIIENGNKKDPEKVGEIIMKAVNDYVKNNSKKGWLSP
jgi:hypothetical protein